MSARDFPEAEILLARGKYATIAGERRQALKGLQEDMTALQSKASLILRMAAMREMDFEGLTAELDKASRALGEALLYVQTLITLAPQLEELKPLAWPKGETNE